METSQHTPLHIAIIMDGNGRWAKQRHLPRTAGHRQGSDAVRRVIESCPELGIKYLTLYAFSSENWERPQGEVDELMGLLKFYIRKELGQMHKNGVRVRVIGDRSRLASDIQADIAEAETITQHNTRLHLNVALSYGSRQEIIHAAEQLAKAKADGNTARLEDFLYTSDLPDPDLLIRTGGEQRLSNFLLWQSAYTELYFTKVLWPDFGRTELEEAIAEFNRRERRYGKTAA